MCAYDTTLLDTLEPPRAAESLAESRWRAVPQVNWLPSLSRGGLSAIVALAGIFLATSFYRLNHTDLWGHLSFGRWIVEHGQLPTTDPWRDFDITGRLVNTAWLGQVLGYLWLQVTGAEGLALAHVLLITLTFGLLMWAIRQQNVSAGWSVVGGIASYLLALPVVGTIRPQLFAGVAFALVLLGITELRRRWHSLLWLPVVFAAWANLHGSVEVGLVTVACVAVDTFWETIRGTRNVRRALADPVLVRIGCLAILALAATCINPAGPRLLLDLAGFAGNGNLEAITEWRPLVIHSLSGVLFFTSVIATAVLLRFSPRAVRLHEILLVVVFGLAALSALRMLYWWAIVWPWVISLHAEATWAALRRRMTTESSASELATTTRTLIAVIVTFLALVWAPSSHNFIVGQPRAEAAVVDRDTPLFVAEEVARRGLEGRIFAPMDWADYLIWQTHGAIKPLVYSHVHLASANVWDDYQMLAGGGAAWQQVIDRHQLRYLVVRRDPKSLLYKIVLGNPRCRCLYQDQQALLIEILPEAPKVAAAARSEK